MTLQGLKVSIIGAGIGGLTVALCLRAKGAHVTLFEQAEAITEVGAGLQISPNGSVVLDALGLADALRQISVRARAVVLRDCVRDGAVTRLDLDRYASDQDYLFVHRSDLIDLLAQSARQNGVQIRLLQRVEEVVPGPTPTIVMKNGARHTADLVIGADGLHSRARTALNGQDAPFFTGQVAWRAVVPNQFDLPNEATVFMGPGRHLVCYPLRGGSAVNIVAVQERDIWAEEGWAHKDDPDVMRAAFAGFGPSASEILNAVQDVHVWGLFRHPVAEAWHGQGVALLGDAAHPTLPFLAQGANMALEDAWVLADALSGATDMKSALDTYQTRRDPRVRRVIEAANGNAWKYHLRNPLIRRAAHLALSIGGKVAPERMVRHFDWLYRFDVTGRS